MTQIAGASPDRGKHTKDSLRKRYFFKVFANIVSASANLVTQLIIPRGLGAAQYGNFCFLTDFFSQFIGFLNMGTSIGFYTKLSKRPRETKLLVFYAGYVMLAVALGLLTVLAAMVVGWRAVLWPSQESKYIYGAVGLAGLTWAFSSMNDVEDAYGLTVSAEMAKILQRIIGLALILVLFCWQWINLDTVFIFNYVILLVALFLFWRINRLHGFGVSDVSLSWADAKGYVAEFYQYSQPLFMHGVVGLVIGIFDRWFLQVEAGGIQQGFFGLSYKVGALCFLLTGAMTQLLTREFSMAYHEKDMTRMAVLFRRHIPLLYGITAVIACFMAVNAERVALIMGGGEFKGATLAVGIMSLYPLHQTYGQLSNAVFYASDQTRLYRNIAVLFMVAGVPVTYFLLASTEHHGLATGATGLAFKMVILNALMVNVCLYFNARFLKIPFWWYVRHQVLSTAFFLFLAWIVTRGLVVIPAMPTHVFGSFILTGMVYIMAVLGLGYFIPGLFGLERKDIEMWSAQALAKLRGQ